MADANRLVISLAILLSLISLKCQSQNSFTFGFKGGSGATVIPVHTVFKHQGIAQDVQMNPQILTGGIIQYEIAGKAGIESGFQFLYHTYSFKDSGGYFKNYFNEPSAIDMTSFQIPVLLNYNFHHRYNVSRYFKITAGTSLDWFSSNLFVAQGRFVSVKNLILGARAGKILEHGKLEFAIEHQYSMNRYSVNGTNYDQLNDRITTRTSFLNFSIMYFLPAKEKSTTL